jgi:glycosyltransferase involved in cell wall biosynthesis
LPARLVVLALEGPDPYALAGGLGVRVSGLVEAMAGLGVETHLIFVGDPDAVATEVRADGRLVLHRWSQWISRYHPGGVYDGEWGKVRDYTNSVPAFVASLVREGIAQGRRVTVLAEEWQTAEALSRLADLVRSDAATGRPLLVWNCNHPLCLDRVDCARLQARSAITTVSCYMRRRLLERGVDARVMPNGIPASMLLPAPDAQGVALKRILGNRLSLVKVGRWDPNKGWLQAIDAGAQLRRAGVPVRLLLRGGVEPYGRDILDRCRAHGLAVHDVTVDDPDPLAMVAGIAAHAAADVLNLRFRLTDAHKRLLFGASDAVVANSLMEPFGLVGLEAMAAGGVAVVGATGEDYANEENALRLSSGTAEELAVRARALVRDPGLAQRIRAAGRRTAREFVWERVLQTTLLPVVAPGRAASESDAPAAARRSERALTNIA